MAARVGVIGLGNIGGHIAANLVADGHAVAVFDTLADRVHAMAQRGAMPVDGPAAVARLSDVTFSSLPTPAATEAVGAEWTAGATPGAVLVDLSTNAPAAVRRLGDRVAQVGCHLLEAPLTGGSPGAQARMLVFMVGGDAAVFARVQPLLATLGRASFHVGPLGSGNTAKLVNSLISFTSVWASLEVLTVAVKAGIDLRMMIDVIRTGGAGNFFTDRMVDGINQRGRPTQFALNLAAKDAELLVEVAREAGVPVPVAAEVAQALVAAVAAGLGERDFTDWVELIERQTNVPLRLGPPRAAN